MVTFAEIQKKADERKLIRKIQKAVAVIAPQSVALPETLFAPGGGLVDLQEAGWLPLGMVDPSGYTFGREMEKEDIDALGYASPARSDTTRVPRTVGVTLLESGRRHVESLKKGMDLSTTTMDPVTGEVVYDEPDLPVNQEWRLLVIGQDGPADEEWVMAKGYGAVKLQNTGEETWGREGAVQSQLTLDVYTDDELGTPVRHYMGGTGALKYKDVLGYVEASTDWAASTAYVAGNRVTLSGGALLECTVAGTSDAVEPTAPAVDATVTDGTVTWKRIS